MSLTTVLKQIQKYIYRHSNCSCRAIRGVHSWRAPFSDFAPNSVPLGFSGSSRDVRSNSRKIRKWEPLEQTPRYSAYVCMHPLKK